MLRLQRDTGRGVCAVLGALEEVPDARLGGGVGTFLDQEVPTAFMPCVCVWCWCWGD